MSNFGFNFRSSLGYVTDGANDAFSDPNGSDTYPTTETIGGESIVFGMTQRGNSQRSRDRNSGIDVRLAGHYGSANNATTISIFRVDLPATGNYDITLGANDASYASTCYLKLLDNTTEIIHHSAVSVASGSAMDANGNVYTHANWPSSNTPINHTFTSTTLFIEIGDTGGSAGDTSLSHLHITSISASTASTTDIPFNEPAGSDYVNVSFGSVDTASTDSVYYGDTASTLNGAQYVYENVTSPSSIAITAISEEGYVTLASTPSITETFDGYVIEDDGTVRSANTFTINIEAASGTESNSVTSVVTSVVNDVVSDLVQ